MKTKKKTQPKSKNKLSPAPSVLKLVPIDFLTKNLNSPITVFDGKRDKIIYINTPLCRLTGYTMEELCNASLEEFLTYIHANDLAVVVNDVINSVHVANKQYLKKANQHVSFTINYRFRKKDGSYVHVLVKNTVLEWDPKIQRMTTLNVYTDISNHKKDPVMHLKIDVFDPVTDLWEMVYEKRFHPQPKMLSKREKEIMLMMAEGNTAIKISEDLDMNYYTVRSHWRTILTKTKCKSQEELKELTLAEGWI